MALKKREFTPESGSVDTYVILRVELGVVHEEDHQDSGWTTRTNGKG